MIKMLDDIFMFGSLLTLFFFLLLLLQEEATKAPIPRSIKPDKKIDQD